MELFDKSNPEMRAESVARQMHQKSVKHSWVDIVKQQVAGGGCPTLRDTLIQPMGAALNETMFLKQAQVAQALLGRAIGEHLTRQNAEVKSIINKNRRSRLLRFRTLPCPRRHRGAASNVSRQKSALVHEDGGLSLR